MLYSEIYQNFQNGLSTRAKRESYNLLLKWVVYCRACPEGTVPLNMQSKLNHQINQLTSWLDASGFYDSPASTQYHEAYPGGLCDHTLKVALNVIELQDLEMFRNVDLASAVLVALVHDWCKIGFYIPYEKNVKDASGNWVKETAFKYSNEPTISLGHGVSSMFLAGKWFTLSDEEALAIRWHMGAWRIVNSECNELQYANENYPLVHLLQFADQLAIVKYNPINNL